MLPRQATPPGVALPQVGAALGVVRVADEVLVDLLASADRAWLESLREDGRGR